MSIPSSEVGKTARSPRRTAEHDAWMNGVLSAALAPPQPRPVAPKTATEPATVKAIEGYKAAIASPKLDRSDFILTTMQLLQKSLGSGAASVLKEVARQYQTQDYDAALQTLARLADASRDRIGDDMASLIAAKGGTLGGKPDENRSRRLYETRLAEHLGQEVRSSETFQESMEGLLATVQRMSAKTGVKIGRLPPPGDPRFAQALLGELFRFNDNIEMGLKAQSPKYGAKDRSDTAKSAADAGESRNTGVMKGSAPNFPDLVTSENQKNRVVDRNRIDPDKAQGQGYSKTNEDVPFVASISGTTFTLVALLEDYLAANAENPKLQRGVDDIVKAFVAQYIRSGFHSYSEMMDVLREPAIAKIFAKAGVAVDMQIPDEVLAKADAEAQAYAKGVATKDTMQAELKATVEEAPAIEPQQPPTGARTGGESLASLLKRTGKETRYEGRPGVYLVFRTAEDTQAAAKRIVAELGPKACRVAGQANTLEIYTGVMGLMGITNQPAEPDLKTLLKRSKAQRAGNRVILQFAHEGDFRAALTRLHKDQLDHTMKVADQPNAIELVGNDLIALMRG